MNLPTKPIEKVYIHITGDQSVGIPNSDFVAEIFIDDKSLDENEMIDFLMHVRDDFKELYSTLSGEFPVGVMFDFELEELIRIEELNVQLREKQRLVEII